MPALDRRPLIIDTAKQLVSEGFNVDEYMASVWKEHKDWCEEQQKIQTKEEWEQGHGCFGFCSTCGQRTYSFDFLHDYYGVCWDCKTHHVISSDLDDVSLTLLAKRYLILCATEEEKPHGWIDRMKDDDSFTLTLNLKKENLIRIRDLLEKFGRGNR